MTNNILHIKYLLLSVLLVGIISACVDPVDVDISAKRSNIVVDGNLNNLEEPQQVRIYQTDNSERFTSSEFSQSISLSSLGIAVSGIEVRVVENGSVSFVLHETFPGIYEMPNGFRGKIGNTYQLLFTTENGNRYQSGIETMLPGPAIDSIYEVFNPVGLNNYLGNPGSFPSNDIYADFQDPANAINYYRWTWRIWEPLNYCESCKQGKYYFYETENGTTGDCFRDLTLNPSTIYDYICGSFCWQIIDNTDINIFSDKTTDGKKQIGKLVGQIPLHQSNVCLVSIRQQALTPAAYRFFKLIQEQSINSGTLADTPPAPIRGNITNLKNEREVILGFFNVSSINEKRFMLVERNTQGGKLNGLFEVLNNRSPMIEPTSNERIDIPLAFCKETLFQTAITPRGWRFGR